MQPHHNEEDNISSGGTKIAPTPSSGPVMKIMSRLPLRRIRSALLLNIKPLPHGSQGKNRSCWVENALAVTLGSDKSRKVLSVPRSQLVA